MNIFKKVSVSAICLLICSSVVFAAFGGLVPCDPADPNPDNHCTLCHLFMLGQNVINFIVKLSIALAVVFIVYGAFAMMFAAGSETIIKKGKDAMTIAVTGMVIVLAAWLIVSEIFLILTGSSLTVPWQQITCSTIGIKP